MIRDACWWWQLSYSSFLFLGLFGGFLFTSALVASVSASTSESNENFSVLVLLGDLSELDSFNLLGNGQSVASYLMSSCSRFELLGGSVVDQTLLGFVFASWEQDKLALVGVESSDVQLELLLTGARSSVINGNSDASGESSCQTGVFDFRKGEAATVANFTSILASGRRDDWTEALGWSGEDAGGLCNSILVSLDLLSWLIEVCFGSSLPVLAKVDIDDHVVVLDHS